MVGPGWLCNDEWPYGAVSFRAAPCKTRDLDGRAAAHPFESGRGAAIEPFEPGTVLAGRTPGPPPSGPYLVVEVTPTNDQPQGLSALDVTYRAVDGWRPGRQRDGGLYRVAVNEPDDSDRWVEPDEELLAACGS